MAMAQPWHLSIVALDALTEPQKPGPLPGFFLARSLLPPS